MNPEVVLTGYGFFNQTRMGGTTREVADTPKGVFTSGKLRWKDFFTSSYKRFSRLDALSQHAVIAVEFLGLPARDDNKDIFSDMALVMGTEFGCLDVDVEYFRSMVNPEGGCPSLFAYTLPSVALGEIAIHYGLTGSNLCLAAGPESGLLAFWEAYAMIVSGEVQTCLCLDCDALTLQVVDSLSAKKENRTESINHARAFLLETSRSANENGRVPLAHIDRQSAPEQTTRPKATDLLEHLCLILSNTSGSPKGVFSLPSPETMRTKGELSIHIGEQRAVRSGHAIHQPAGNTRDCA